MPSPCSASFIKIIQQLILLERHAGQDIHIHRALLGSQGSCVPILLFLGGLVSWLEQLNLNTHHNMMGMVTAL